MSKDPRDAFDPLGGVHVFIDDNGIVLRIVEGDGLQVEQGTEDGEIGAQPVQGNAGEKAIGSFLLCLRCFFSHKRWLKIQMSGKRAGKIAALIRLDLSDQVALAPL